MYDFFSFTDLFRDYDDIKTTWKILVFKKSLIINKIKISSVEIDA